MAIPALKRNSSAAGKLGKRMATAATFTACKGIHFVKCVRTFGKYLEGAGTFEREETLLSAPNFR